MEPSRAASHKSGKTVRRIEHDDGPIVFPEPVSFSSALPPPSPCPDDVIIDPYGQYYCFVCKVAVPKGKANIEQHLSGRRHDGNNARFANDRERKANVKRNVIAQSAIQRQALIANGRIAPGSQRPEHNNPPRQSSAAATSHAPQQLSTLTQHLQRPSNTVTCAPGQSPPARTVPISVTHPNAVPIPAPITGGTRTAGQDGGPPGPSHTPVAPIQDAQAQSTRPRPSTRPDPRVKVRKEAERLKGITIDKDAFLAELIGQEQSPSENGTLSSATSKNGTDIDNTNPELVFEQRHGKLQPIVFQAPAGPDFFFDSIAQETAPTPLAKRVRDLFAEHAAKAEANKSVQNASANEDNQPQKDTKSANQMESQKSSGSSSADFIPMTTKDETAEKKENTVFDESRFITLRDDSGECLPPWLLDQTATQNVLVSPDSHVALHFEILQFAQFMSPTAEENNNRREMIMTVEAITQKLWPGCSASIFGSYATGLCLPSSDVDMCVMGTPNGGTLEEFQQLAEAVRNVTGFARHVEVVKAKVPLVKIIGRASGVNCDISIGVENGLRNVPVIMKYVEEFPALRPLILVIKCFMQQRSINSVFTGGLGSFSLFLLVVSHLQMLRCNFPKCGANLGSALIAFFQLYGRLLNFCLTGIRVKNGGCYFDKFDAYQTPPSETMRYCMEDPNDETNEPGRNSFMAYKIRRAFGVAYETLEKWRRLDSTGSPTPLGSIINSDLIFQERRRSVIEDLERNGKKSIRETVSGQPLSAEALRRVEKEKEASSQHMNGGLRGNQVDQGASPKRREPRSVRERDPRKVEKRRRSAAGLDNRPGQAERGSSVSGAGRRSERGTDFRRNDGTSSSSFRNGSESLSGQRVSAYSGSGNLTSEVQDGLNPTRRVLVPAGANFSAGASAAPVAATPGYQYAGGSNTYANGAPLMPVVTGFQLPGAYAGDARHIGVPSNGGGVIEYPAMANGVAYTGTGGQGNHGIHHGGARD